jgi:two-component system response regulator AtoC
MVLEELAASAAETASEELRESLAPRLTREALQPGKVSLKPLAARAAEEAEKRIVLAVLEETHWNRRRAAARLDICYKTLLNKLHHWQLSGAKRRPLSRDLWPPALAGGRPNIALLAPAE